MSASVMGAALLRYLYTGPLDDVGLLIYAGPRRKSVIDALERRGLVRYFPNGGERRQGVWRITSEGRELVERDDAEARRAP